MVRDPRGPQSASKLKKKSGVEVLDENIVMADVTDPASLTKAMEGVDAIVLCTSAVPKASGKYEPPPLLGRVFANARDVCTYVWSHI